MCYSQPLALFFIKMGFPGITSPESKWYTGVGVTVEVPFSPVQPPTHSSPRRLVSSLLSVLVSPVAPLAF